MENKKCPVCGYQKEAKYNPSKQIMQLKRIRTKYTRKLLIKVVNLIMASIPSENDINREYMFYQSISKIDDGLVEYIVNRYLSEKTYHKGKGFKYLTAMILNFKANRETVSNNELLMRGKPPSVITIKED
tara:strand:- start:13897 stop:14286 length:390 start_codon:yes stop_codon:yes gene_type:complete